ncbi:MAG TPA: hypothetical protein DEA96_03825 [Leptospiraceae bacterium]|nr:hypothetical protein [Leptospiraceae bacterium]|tara:strand:- start:10999 stop:11727 length:729 start_codon:yes stop_codon:yes gene_type:complete
MSVVKVQEKPMIFSGDMVRRILDGYYSPGNGKTITRRIINRLSGWGQIKSIRESDFKHFDWLIQDKQGRYHNLTNAELLERCPYGQVGTRLWVRENCRARELESGLDGVQYEADGSFIPIENSEEASEAWGRLASHNGAIFGGQVPSIHMPRWASRILLEVTALRAERLCSITEADAIAEGVSTCGPVPITGEYKTFSAVERFRILWDFLNNGRGPKERRRYGWAQNPPVWVLSFKVLEVRK